MKSTPKPFKLDKELNEVDEILKDELQNTEIQSSFTTAENTIDIANAAVICIKIIVESSSIMTEMAMAFRIIKKVIYDIFQDNEECIDVAFMGRSFCGVFNAPLRVNIDEVLETMGKLNAAISVLDLKLNSQFGIKVKGVVCADFGTVIRYVDSESNEISWYGTPITNVVELCNEKSEKETGVTVITFAVKSNLKEDYAKFFDNDEQSVIDTPTYKAYLVNTEIFNWVKQHKLEQNGTKQDTEEGN